MLPYEPVVRPDNVGDRDSISVLSFPRSVSHVRDEPLCLDTSSAANVIGAFSLLSVSLSTRRTLAHAHHTLEHPVKHIFFVY